MCVCVFASAIDMKTISFSFSLSLSVGSEMAQYVAVWSLEGSCQWQDKETNRVRRIERWIDRIHTQYYNPIRECLYGRVEQSKAANDYGEKVPDNKKESIPRNRYNI